MFANWPERIEALLVVLLSGFAFWPLPFSSFLLIALLAVRIARAPRSWIPDRFDLLMWMPAILMGVLWAAYGFADDGVREMQLWPILPVALVIFKSAETGRLFRSSFMLLSVLQAVLILGFLALSDPIRGQGFAWHIRDLIQTSFRVHPTFVSAAWAWAALLIWLEAPLRPWVRLSVFFFLALMAALCGGKMPLLALIGLMLWFVSRDLRLSVRHRAYYFAAVALVVVAVFLSPVMRERLAELRSISTGFTEGQMLTSSELRTGIWRCAVSEIDDHFWTGVGVGNTRQALETCYGRYGQAEFIDGEFNTHNQYLHVALAGGVLALMLFLALVVGTVVYANRSGSSWALAFVIFFWLICLTENYFSRQFGMMLWSFFAAMIPRSSLRGV